MSVNDIEIRKAIFSDAFSISSVIRDAFLTNVSEYNTEKGSLFFVRVQSPKYYEKKIKEFRTFLVAEADGSIVATIAIHERLVTFFVLEEYQNRGLGRKLFRAALADWSSQSDQATLTVNASPNAVGFYQKLGFENLGEPRIENDIWCVAMIGKVQDLLKV